MIDDRTEIVTIMYGADVNEGEVTEIEEFLSKNYSVEVEVIAGGQDIYSYIMTVE